jgi:hypothetical protein
VCGAGTAPQSRLIRFLLQQEQEQTPPRRVVSANQRDQSRRFGEGRVNIRSERAKWRPFHGEPEMTSITKIGIAALMLGGAAVAAPGAANAEVSFGISLPGVHIWTGGYNYHRPCSWYRYYDVPAPRHCYGYLESYWGGNIYTDGDFIFRDRDDYGRWQNRPAYQHWREHDYSYNANQDRDWERQHGWSNHGHYGDNRGNENGNDQSRHDQYGDHNNLAYDHGSRGNLNNGDNMSGNGRQDTGNSMQGGNSSQGQGNTNTQPGNNNGNNGQNNNNKKHDHDHDNNGGGQ